jgi:hypothetical protein
MELKKTITSIFMVPTLKINKDDFKNNGFLNGYLRDKRRHTQYKNAVYLLFKPDDFDVFREFLEREYERTKNVLDDYDYEDGFVIIVYKLDKKWSDDFLLIREGKYSQTSKQFQEVFPKVIKIMKKGLHRDEISLQHRIFKKTSDLKEYWENRLDMEFTEDMELWEGFDERLEILDLDKIKEEQLV